MNKKDIKILIGVCIFFILILFGLIVYLVYFNESFDPKKHECIKAYYIFHTGSWTKEVFIKDNYVCVKDKDYTEFEVFECVKCEEWRDKSFCELHPTDSERCVCEGYEKMDVLVNFLCDLNGNCEGDTQEEDWCVKARKKTVEDLTCGELDDLFLNGNPCVKREHPIGSFVVSNPCVKRKYAFLKGYVIDGLKRVYWKHSSYIDYLMDKKGCFNDG